MKNPRKDYELLMRYLQRDAHRPQTVPSMPSNVAEESLQIPLAQPLVVEPVSAERKVPPTAVRPYRPSAVEHVPQPRMQGMKRYVKLAIAVAALLFFILLCWKAFSFYSLNNQKIFDSMYVPFVAEDKTPGSTGTPLENFYISGNYVAATMQARKQKELSEREQFITGLAYMQRNEYGKAAGWLEPITKNFKSPYRHQADYYLALTYLRNEDYDRCIAMLKHIRNVPDHPYREHIPEQTINDIQMLKWK